MTALSPAERNKYIGASEAAALPGIGVSPYTTPFELFHIKAGDIPPDDLDGVERIQAGQFLEPGIAAWAAHKFGMQLRPVAEYRIHPSVQGMGASWDYEEAANEDEAPPVELKNVDGWQFKQNWDADGDVILHAPLHILIQVQHQLALRPKAPHGWVVACVGGNELKRMMIPRHEKTITTLEESVANFWRDVKEGNEPDPDWEADASTIAKLYGAAGEDVVDMTGDVDLANLALRYTRLKGDIKELDTKARGIKSQILPLIGDAKKVLCDGATISAGMVNKKEYTVQPSSYRNFRITKKKEK